MKKFTYFTCIILTLKATAGLSQGIFGPVENATSTETSLPLPPVINIAFSGKILLEGAFDPETGLMSNSLNSLGILATYALSQPYNIPEFGNYNGTEEVSSAFFSEHPEIVDWVLLTVNNPDQPGMSLRRAAFVRQDGTLVDVDGTSTQITFNELAGGNYYVSVQHRNHLGIRSSLAVNFSTGKANYDFTTSADKSYQNQEYTSTVQYGDMWLMRGGNANSDNSVNDLELSSDQVQIQNAISGTSMAIIVSNKYSAADVNLDGVVKVNGPKNDSNFLLNKVLKGSLNAIYVEQL